MISKRHWKTKKYFDKNLSRFCHKNYTGYFLFWIIPLYIIQNDTTFAA